ncbi:hypothetical protein V496_03640 [Pseudogymnoascus sp. VKM F-4515 (FW-2607)]|nr:hypothetical protein V496_03640 [Pseudogymnoascus sp. VKM F-4515 (FW-2607)]KFY95598.1 hypothetical protein V498_03277 [Pseudogymnoascus sp. VKM F-4517 (FW-2822)]
MKFLTIVATVLLSIYNANLVAAGLELPPIGTPPPSCGLKCIAEFTKASECSPTDKKCICTNAQLNHDITVCVSKSCSVVDSLATKKFSSDSCGVVPQDRTKVISIVGVTFGVLALITFGLRILSKVLRAGGQFGLDDYTIMVAMAITVPFCAFSVLLANHGLGRDMWNVHPEDITAILYIYYWDELMYVAIVPLTKISIIFLYLRIFRGKSFIYFAYALIAANVAYLLAFEAISIFQCWPINGAWRAWDGSVKATCRNVNLQGWMSATFSIILDVLTLILPLPSLYKLEMSMKKRIQIMMMFSVGVFVTIVSFVRIRAFTKYANTTNLTQDYVELGYWSTIEVPVGVICACMPSIRALFRNVFPSLFGTTQNGQSSTGRLSTTLTAPSKSRSEYANLSKHEASSSVIGLVPLDNRQEDERYKSSG